MKFIHIADVHLGMKPDKNHRWSDLREREIKETLDRLFSVVKEKQIELLLVAGDLFHRPPLVRELRELDYKFSQMKDTKVVLIAGNHDFIGKDTAYESFCFSENVTFLNTEEAASIYLEDIDTTVTGLSYHSREIRKAVYDELKPEGRGCHILIAHGGDEKHVPIDTEKLKWSGFDYIALGHIHKPEIVAEDFMAYPGSLEPLDYTETGSHGYIAGEITRDHQKIEFVPFCARKYIDLQIYVDPEMTQSEILDQIKTKMLQYGDHNIFHIILNGDKSIDLELDFYFIEQEFQIVKISDFMHENYDIDLLYQENRDNIIGDFIGYFDKGQGSKLEQKALEYGIKALLQARESMK